MELSHDETTEITVKVYNISVQIQTLPSADQYSRPTTS